MYAAAALLLVTGLPGAISPPAMIPSPPLAVSEPPLCPAPVMRFAPPLHVPLTLTRRVERDLKAGRFVQTVIYHVTFSQAGRGYRMDWVQTGQQVQGPADLLRLLALQEDASTGEHLDFTLDADGAILGVSESPDSAVRLARAIDGLRSDPALTGRPAAERETIELMLARLVALPARARAALHQTKAERLLMFAGRSCADDGLVATDGRAYRLGGASGNQLILLGSNAEQRSDGSRLTDVVTARLSVVSGLTEHYDRRSVSTVAGTMSHSRESVVLTTP